MRRLCGSCAFAGRSQADDRLRQAVSASIDGLQQASCGDFIAIKPTQERIQFHECKAQVLSRLDERRRRQGMNPLDFVLCNSQSLFGFDLTCDVDRETVPHNAAVATPRGLGNRTCQLARARFESRDLIYKNSTGTLLHFAEGIRAVGLKPCLVSWGIGFTRFASSLLDMGLVDKPAYMLLDHRVTSAIEALGWLADILFVSGPGAVDPLDGCAPVRAATAPRRVGTLHRVQRPQGPWRCRRRRRAHRGRF